MKKYTATILLFVMLTLCLPMPARAAGNISVPGQLTVVIGNEKQIEVDGVGIGRLEFTSTNTRIASVDDDGFVNGKKPGSCQVRIFATLGGDSVTKTTRLTVVKKAGFSASKIYKKMMAQKKNYPEGKSWTNANSYLWKAIPHVNYYAYGCAAFASIVSDAAFGKYTVAKQINSPAASRVRVGDILRVSGDTHSVIVLKVETDGFVIAEGNYNSSIHWGRKLSKKEPINYLYTRYEG